MALKRWLYAGGRPKKITKIINQGWAWLHSTGILPDSMVTLEVVGRQSGKLIRFPVAVAKQNGERYLVSMLGNDANWVRNVKAANGQASLQHGKREAVRLEEVDVQQRAAIIKAYLQIAPGARPHIPVDKDAPLAAFAEAAPKIPVFRILSRKP